MANYVSTSIIILFMIFLLYVELRALVSWRAIYLKRFCHNIYIYIDYRGKIYFMPAGIC